MKRDPERRLANVEGKYVLMARVGMIDTAAARVQDRGMHSPKTSAQFVAKWEQVSLAERAASQSHFIDLCRVLQQPTPTDHDATGTEYTFEKGVSVTGPASKGAKGTRGFADVWWRGKFAWEYKTKDKHATLHEAYQQLCQYREALENPPLLIVSDISRTEIHTNFTGTAKRVHEIGLHELVDPEKLDLLRRAFSDPASFEPSTTSQAVTERAASGFGDLAQRLQGRGEDPHVAAHFLMKCMFCLFAEDIGLLPKDLFARLLGSWKGRPPELRERMDELFLSMSSGGAFGLDEIAFFNGGLFNEGEALELQTEEIRVLSQAADHDWASVEPAVFGTLFERSLDPDKRTQIGAHYTGRADILDIVEPVLMLPLREQWQQVQEEVLASLERAKNTEHKQTRSKALSAIEKKLDQFLGVLSSVRILDPACGSGNFLYVAIQRLLELEKEVITFAARPDIGIGLFPHVSPEQLLGIEINPYAAELAQVVIWIGYLQWMHFNGFTPPRDPILQPLRSIRQGDAIVSMSQDGPTIPDWPAVDFIIGNPPFLGSKQFRRSGLDENYIRAMYALYDIPGTSDLCCYWFEQARRSVHSNPKLRVGLLATQGIRGIANRKVLERIKEVGEIFYAWSDRKWALEGAMVQTSFICFDSGADNRPRMLDGKSVPAISVKLTSGVDVTLAKPLPENRSLSFMGTTKGGSFEIEIDEALRMLRSPNPTDVHNESVIAPWINGDDVTDRPRGLCIIDFGCGMVREQAACYGEPFGYVERVIRKERVNNQRESYRDLWWQLSEPRPEFRAACQKTRYIGTPNLTKHRVFVMVDSRVIPDHQLIAFPRDDYYFFGVLESSIHEIWARAQGSQLRERESGFRYTPVTCFDTFPFPWSPGEEPYDTEVVVELERAAMELDQRRTRWIKPPEIVDRISDKVRAEHDLGDLPQSTASWVQECLVQQRCLAEERLAERTLTQLYNQRLAGSGTPSSR